MSKLCIIINSLFHCGGEERVVTLLANELVKTNEITIFTSEKSLPDDSERNSYGLDNRIQVCFSKEKGDSFFEKMIKLLYCHTGMSSGRLSQLLLEKAYYPNRKLEEWIQIINAGKFDLVIGVSGLNTMLLGYISGKISCATIGWEHSSFEGYFDEKNGYYRNRMKLYKKTASRLDKIVVLNKDIQRKYRKILNIETEVISNPRSFTTMKKANMDSHYFITCGRMEKEKAIDDMIDVFSQFCQHRSDWKLIIVGGGSLLERLQRQAFLLKIEDKVIFTGYSDDVIKWLASSSIFLLTSRWEGFPMSVTEAFEVGIPVISYDIPAMSSLVNDGVEGYLAKSFDKKEFVDKMIMLSDDMESRKKMSLCTLRKADELSIEKIAMKWRNIINGVIR